MILIFYIFRKLSERPLAQVIIKLNESVVNEDPDYDEDSSSEKDEPQKPRILIRSTIAQRIRNRQVDAPEPIDDIPNQTAEERRKLMHQVSIKLERSVLNHFHV